MKAPISEVYNIDCMEYMRSIPDGFYLAKINFITLDERSGSEKKTASYILCQASTLEDARKVLVEGMKDTMADYAEEAIKETKIMDVFVEPNE